jgi:hypothetical protein
MASLNESLPMLKYNCLSIEATEIKEFIGLEIIGFLFN